MLLALTRDRLDQDQESSRALRNMQGATVVVQTGEIEVFCRVFELRIKPRPFLSSYFPKLSHACIIPPPFERQEDVLWGRHLRLMTNKTPCSKLAKRSLIRNTTLYTHGPIAKSTQPKVEERSQPKGQARYSKKP